MLLSHEIESWNDSSGNSYIWVEVPQIDAGSTTDCIYMYYDKPGEPAPSLASQQATWSNSFESVYHLHNDCADSTGNKSAGTNSGSTDGTTTRLAGDYQTFSGTAQYINTNWTPDYTSSQNFTWEGWFKTTNSLQGSDDILGIEDRFGGAGVLSEIRLSIRESLAGQNNPVDVWDVILRPNPGGNYAHGQALTVNTEWHYVALVRDGGTARTYLDGTQVHSAAVGTGALTFPTRAPWFTVNRLLIGAQWSTDAADAVQRNWMEGDIDEVRTGIATARNADWFDATFQTIKNCSAFSSVSAAASQPSISKSFAPSTIAVNGISTLTITIDNTQPGAIALSALALNDVFPADVVIAATPNESTTCTAGTVIATAAANNIDLSGASLGAGSSCTFQADVTAPSAGVKATNIPAAALNNAEGLHAAADANDTLTVAATISGTVFEDINYGGGDGRTYAAADTSAQGSGWVVGDVGSGPNVRVELYQEQAGNYIKIDDTLTDATGAYTFSGVANDTYRVRVVNDTVISNRGSNATGFAPFAVQTFRNDPDSGGPVINEVGGASPNLQDAGNQGNGTDLSTITAQSVTEIVVSGANVTTVNFGFNFDTIVNDNDASQGSLRQFMLNSNELDNVNLDQEDAPSGVTAVTKSAGDEHSIFMILVGELVATIDGGGGTVMLIQPTVFIDPITDNNTAVDGSTQTAYTGDTNFVVAETTTGPEVILDYQTTVMGPGLNIQANNVLIDRLGVANVVRAEGSNNDGAGIIVNGANNVIFQIPHHGTTIPTDSGRLTRRTICWFSRMSAGSTASSVTVAMASTSPV